MRTPPPPYGIIYNWDGAPHDYSTYPQSLAQFVDKVCAPLDDTQVGGGGVGSRGFTRFDRPVAGVRWIDNDEELRFAHEGGLLCIEATGYPYGVDRVVRIAEMK